MCIIISRAKIIKKNRLCYNFTIFLCCINNSTNSVERNETGRKAWNEITGNETTASSQPRRRAAGLRGMRGGMIILKIVSNRLLPLLTHVLVQQLYITLLH